MVHHPRMRLVNCIALPLLLFLFFAIITEGKVADVTTAGIPLEPGTIVVDDRDIITMSYLYDWTSQVSELCNPNESQCRLSSR